MAVEGGWEPLCWKTHSGHERMFLGTGETDATLWRF